MATKEKNKLGGLVNKEIIKKKLRTFLYIGGRTNQGYHYSRHRQSNVRQSNEIELNPWIEFGNRTKSNTRLSVSSISEQIEFNRKKSNSIELNPSDCVRLGSETGLNRTQSNGLRSIGSGKPIQSKPKASLSKQVFLVRFYNLFL